MLTKQKQLMESPPAPTYSLQPYKGEWSFQQAAHLLRRTTFGATYEDIKAVAEKGLDISLDEIMRVDTSQLSEPINYDYEKDPYVPVGSSWIDQPYNRENNSTGYRLPVSYTHLTLPTKA